MKKLLTTPPLILALSACGENATPPSDTPKQDETTKETVLAPSEQNPKPATQTADDDTKNAGQSH